MEPRFDSSNAVLWPLMDNDEAIVQTQRDIVHDGAVSEARSGTLYLAGKRVSDCSHGTERVAIELAWHW